MGRLRVIKKSVTLEISGWWKSTEHAEMNSFHIMMYDVFRAVYDCEKKFPFLWKKVIHTLIFDEATVEFLTTLFTSSRDPFC